MALPGAETLASLAGTFVIASVFYAVTAHLAATFVVGDVSIVRAVLVGPVPALILVTGGWLASLPVAAAIAIPADYAAIQWSYEIDRHLAVGVTVGHVVASVLLTVSLFGLLGSLGAI